jgi:hypothetical protein
LFSFYAAPARSLERLHAIADQIGAPRMIWNVSYYEAFVATMEACFADAEELGSEAFQPTSCG